ncbi:cytoplasm protein [Papiliotrema laurentii]|uniref:Cytoplasm protein n=1 Tax=Papiliotrema laurentii TaxID=5418 RepID=A0AAD9FRV2_PAPLA|nr:cytoplasm protein [Papiliotrema laurentii]
MCRFIVYKGAEPIQLAHLVTRPRHSIINQAFESKLRLPSTRPLNADGFGIGWYDPQDAPAPGMPGKLADVSDSPSPAGSRTPGDLIDNAKADGEGKEAGKDEGKMNGNEEDLAAALEIVRRRQKEVELENERPCVFKSLSPAWSNANLIRLAEKIRSPLIFAHVRATTSAGAPSEENCHPWIFDRLMWMHNGEISQFQKIKRALQFSLPEELFLFPSGGTDSEWAFMVFLSKLKNPHARSFTHVELRDAMLETLKHINKLLQEAGVTTPSLLNYVVSDGETVVAIRYVTSRTCEAASLFFSSGTSFDEYAEGMYRMTKADKRENLIMIASEPLTFERSDWMEVKSNTMLVITPKMNILQIPIIDEYWVPPQDPNAHHRSKDFAISMGFGYGFAPPDAPIITA